MAKLRTGPNHPKLYHPEDFEKLRQAAEAAIADGKPYELELRAFRKDGETRICIAMGFPETGKDGQVVRLFGLLQDITEKKQAEKEIQESEEKFRLLYENAGLGIGYWTADGKVISFNKTATENMKGEPDDFIGKSAVEVFGNVNGSTYLERITKTATSKQTLSFEDTVFLPSGEKTFLSNYNAVLAENGDVRGVQIISTDITERKKIEKEIIKIKASLEDAQRIANVGNWEWDLRTNNAWWSDELYRIYGREKSLGPPAINYFHSNIHTDDIKHLEQAINQSMETGEYKADFRLLTYDTKEIRDVHAEGRVEYDDNGKPIKHFGVVQDVTDKKKLESQLKQVQKLESIGNLAGGIAHDFNNILSSIIGFTELAIDEASKGTMLEDSLQEVYSAGKRAKNLVKQILAVARQSEEKIGPVQPSVVAKEVLKFVRSAIPTTIEIHQEIESDALIMGNATQVHQVLMNLCTNAAYAMEDSGGLLSVSLKDVYLNKEDLLVGMKPGGYVEIKISDSGTGIAPEIIDSIFDPYFTTKGVGEGTGLGLATVQGVVESYGGKIVVDTQLEKGTTFTICLPITKMRSDQEAYVPEELPTGTERILFVDDEAPIAKMGSQILERLGYSVTTRTSSIEALELFQGQTQSFRSGRDRHDHAESDR
jgi:PAS domain S-box-containing protein